MSLTRIHPVDQPAPGHQLLRHRIHNHKVGPFRPSRTSILDLGWGWRDCVFFVLIAILDKVDGKLRPPLPSSQRWESGVFWPLYSLIISFWGKGGITFSFPFLSKIVALSGRSSGPLLTVFSLIIKH